MRFTRNEFDLNGKSTIGIEFSTRNVIVENKKIKAQVWDTAGQERYRAITPAFYRGAVGALIIYDITNKDTFKDTKLWMNEIRDHSDDKLAVILVGNKSDLANKRQVSVKEATKYAKSLGVGFMETSALTAENIDTAF